MSTRELYDDFRCFGQRNPTSFQYYEDTFNEEVVSIGKAYKRQKNYNKALLWYLYAYNNYSSEAAFEISEMYKEGLGVPQDYILAAEWLLNAAGYLHYNATYFLGEMFEHGGHGLPVDKKIAMQFYFKFNIHSKEGYRLQKEGVPEDLKDIKFGYGFSSPENDARKIIQAEKTKSPGKYPPEEIKGRTKKAEKEYQLLKNSIYAFRNVFLDINEELTLLENENQSLKCTIERQKKIHKKVLMDLKESNKKLKQKNEKYAREASTLNISIVDHEDKNNDSAIKDDNNDFNYDDDE